MPESAFCNACGAWITVSPDGCCPHGHQRSQLRGLRQGAPPQQGAPAPSPVGMHAPGYDPPAPSATPFVSSSPTPTGLPDQGYAAPATDFGGPAAFPPPAPTHELRAGDAGGGSIPIGVATSATVDPRALMTPSYIPDVRPDMSDLISGQKCVIWAILLNLGGYGITLIMLATVGPLGGSGMGIGWLVVSQLIGGVTWLMSMWGVYQMVHSMGSSFLFFPAMFIPVISLLALLMLNAQATGRLRGNGYEVGLLGAVNE